MSRAKRIVAKATDYVVGAMVLWSWFAMLGGNPFRAQLNFALNTLELNNFVQAQVAAPDIGAPTGPLTVERDSRPSPIVEDYQVGALQEDFTGSLWVGSHQGLSR
ncbi:MAG: hypothetical protein AAFZ17_17535, partial [Cyanobacteria bacterium J06650_10]